MFKMHSFSSSASTVPMFMFHRNVHEGFLSRLLFFGGGDLPGQRAKCLNNRLNSGSSVHLKLLCNTRFDPVIVFETSLH